jgi:dihydroneopterin aldolase
MGIVLLEGMEFLGYHGVYPEEQVLGNRFLVNLELHTDFEDAMLTDRLDGTVDYAQLYQLVKLRMGHRVQLLEHLGYGIIQDIRAAYPKVSKIRITLKKHQPAIGGLMDFSGVTISYPEDFS